MEQFYYTYQKNSIVLKQYAYRIGSYHYNWHKELELLVVISGEIEVCVDGVPHILHSDDVILINSHKGHATLARSPDSTAMVLHISPDFFRNYYENLEYLNFDCCSDAKTRKNYPFVLIRAYLSEMMLGHGKHSVEGELLFQSAFYSLLHTIVLHFPPKQLPSTEVMILRNHLDAVEKIVRYIDKHYTQKITLNDLARVSQYNRNYISQFFKSYLGINFHDYLTRIRLREATLELGRTNKSVSEIALAHGFPDLKSFNSAFRTSFGKTPTEYRRQLSEDITRYDINFKREFLPWTDEMMHQILIRYVMEKTNPNGQTGAVPTREYSQAVESVQIASEMILKLKSVSHDIQETVEGLENIIGKLSQ